MPVSELLDRMPAAELTEWAALYKLENGEAKTAQARNRSKPR